MLVDSRLPVHFWSEAVAHACYTQNRVLTVEGHGKTSYELLHRRKPDLQWLEPFGAPCTKLVPHDKFDPKAEEAYFLGNSVPNRRVWNNKTRQIELWSEVNVL